MKKILTTTVITAILATSGFADEPVEEWVYGTATFPSGTDKNPTTIMPSGTVNIGDTSKFPVIASDWTLEPGSTMNVTGLGFCLTKEIKINPKDVGAIPVQCAIGEQLYYKYTYTDVIDGAIKAAYRLVSNPEARYVDSFGNEIKNQPSEVSQVVTTGITGVPVTTNNAVINMSYNEDEEKLEGCISGGTVTYIKEGAGVLSNDDTSYESSFPLIGKTKYTLTKAAQSAFQESYITSMPTLLCDQTTWSIADIDEANVLDSNTLQSYLNSFGFYPDPVTVLSGTRFNLLTLKGDDAAIQLPGDAAFSTAASGKEYNITANLHNVSAEFDHILLFTGTGVEDNMDTLIFSGDNSNLTPDNGVMYTNVNVTFECANSWIAAPKDKAVTLMTTGTNTSTVTVCKNLSICSDLNVRDAVSIVGPKDTTIKLFGTVTFW